MILYLVVESAPKRFLLETDGESNEEKQEIDENAATRGMRGWMDRMNKKMIGDGKQAFGQEKRNRFLGPFCKAFSLFSFLLHIIDACSRAVMVMIQLVECPQVAAK